MTGHTERETMEFDVVIVGAGPAGLAAAIKLRQLAAEKGSDVSVVVLEKGSEVGAHILSGAVIDPVGLDGLLPDWRNMGSPLQTQVTEDRFYYLWKTGGIRVPNLLMPPLMSNHCCYIGSLGSLTRWLAEQAEGLGVEIYPGFSVIDVIYGESGAIEGVITGDMGVARDGSHKDGYTPGIALRGKYTLFAEGARGSLSKMLSRSSASMPSRARRNSASASRSCSALIDPDADLRDLTGSLFEEGVAGYYDPRDGRLRVVKGTGTVNRVISEITMAHELDHALEDQRFGLDEPKTSDDRALAYVAPDRGIGDVVDGRLPHQSLHERGGAQRPAGLRVPGHR